MSNDIKIEVTTLDELNAYIEKAHNPDLAKMQGMVYTIFDDGEICLQKSGDLLWQRTLHTISFACINGPLVGIKMPCRINNNGYIFATGEDCEIIRKAIGKVAITQIEKTIR
jgi:hypothetical protein